MKHLLILFSVLIFSTIFTSCSSDSNDDNDKEQAKKYPSEMAIKEYQWKFGEKSNYGEDYEKYTYDFDGKLIKKETNYYVVTLGDRLPRSYTYSYDNEGRLIEKNAYMIGILQDKFKYTYNDFDSVAIMTDYNNEGTLTEEWTYSYNDQHRLIRADEINSILLAYVDDYSYSGNNVTIISHEKKDGSLFGTTLYEYDDHYNLLKKTWTNGDTGRKDLEIWNEYEYNSNGKIAKMISHDYVSKEDLTYKTYTYNNDGSIKSIHISYSFKNDQSDLDYTYTWK